MRKIKRGKKEITLFSLWEAIDQHRGCELNGFGSFLHSIKNFVVDLSFSYRFRIGNSAVLDDQLAKHAELSAWLVKHDFAEWDETELELPIFAKDEEVNSIYELIISDTHKYVWYNKAYGVCSSYCDSIIEAILNLKSAQEYKMYKLNKETMQLEEITTET